jgi:hypothetical protein
VPDAALIVSTWRRRVMGISRSPEGASTVNWYLAVAAGLLDELWLYSSPVTLGAGERLFVGVPPLNREPLGIRANELVTNVRYRVQRQPADGEASARYWGAKVIFDISMSLGWHVDGGEPPR